MKDNKVLEQNLILLKKQTLALCNKTFSQA